MKYEILTAPDFGMARVEFERADEALVVESGAMVARDTDLKMKTQMKGGLLNAAKRKLLGGESLFLNTFTASKAGEVLFIAPSMEGDLRAMEIRSDRELAIQSGAFVASSPRVELDTKWGGLKGFFSGHGIFFLKASGEGPVFVNSYGAIHEIELDGSRSYIVDNNHIVAFTCDLEYHVRKVGGLKSLFLSGEGLVCEFKGRGRIWIQTRNPSSFASWVNGFRRQASSS